MPYDDPNSWISEDLLKQQQDLARQFGRTPQATSPFGALAQGLGGIFGGLANTNVAAGLEQNQNVMADAMRKAAGAKSTADLSGILMSSGIPQLGVRGMDFKASGLQRQEEQNSPQALANLQRTRMGIAQLQQELEQARKTNPLKVQELEENIKKLKQRDAMETFKAELLGVGPQQPEQPAQPSQPTLRPQSYSAPEAPSVPSGAMPISNPGAPSTPSPVPGVTLVADNQPKATPEIDTSKLTDAQFLRWKAKSGDALKVYEYFKMLDKDATKARAMLDEMRNPDKIAKATQHDVDRDLIAATNLLSGLNEIQTMFNPTFLQAGGQIQNYVNSLRAKLGGGESLNEEQKAALQQYASFRSASWGVLNKRIKDMSGAAVTGNELERMLKDMPNPGTGIADGDDAVTFQAKLERTMKTAKMAVARLHYIRSQGWKGDITGLDKDGKLPALDQMPDIMRKEGAATMKRIKDANPGISDEEAFKRAKAENDKKFGLDV